MDALPLACVRLFGLGALGGAGVRRPIGGGSILGKPLSRCVLRIIKQRTGDCPESDPLRIPAVDSGRTSRAQDPADGASARDFWRGSSGNAEPGTVVRPTW